MVNTTVLSAEAQLERPACSPAERLCFATGHADGREAMCTSTGYCWHEEQQVHDRTHLGDTPVEAGGCRLMLADPKDAEFRIVFAM